MSGFYNLERRVFQLSLGMSFLVHALLLVQLSQAKVVRDLKPLKQIEVTYHDIIPALKETRIPKLGNKPVKEENKKDVLPLPKFKEIHPGRGQDSSLIRDMTKLLPDENLVKAKSKPMKLSQVNVEKKITLSDFKTKVAESPSYVGYDLVIRDQIKSQVDKNVDPAIKEKGDVNLVFIVAASGELKDIKVISDKTNASFYLRDICLRSVKEASPFKPFPKDLNYSELPFSVTITFE